MSSKKPRAEKQIQSADVKAPAGHITQLVPPLATVMYDPALHPELVHTTWSSPSAACHPDCSGKSTITSLPLMEVTVPTLERVTEPQPYCGVDTDGSTWTELPTLSGWEHAVDEVAAEQAVAPDVRQDIHQSTIIKAEDCLSGSASCR